MESIFLMEEHERFLEDYPLKWQHNDSVKEYTLNEDVL